MKKIISVISIILMIFLSACSSKPAEPEEVSLVPEDAVIYDNAEDAQRYLESLYLDESYWIEVYTTLDLDDSFIHAAQGVDKNRNPIKVPKFSYSDYLYEHEDFRQTKYTMEIEGNVKIWEINSRYSISRDEYTEIDKAVTGIVNSLKSSTDADKIRELTNVVSNYLTYKNNRGIGFEKVMQTREGDCLDYSKLFFLCAKKLGYDCRIICGKSQSNGHAWNIVEVDDKWYYVDATPEPESLFGTHTLNTSRYGYTIDEEYENLINAYDISDEDYPI